MTPPFRFPRRLSVHPIALVLWASVWTGCGATERIEDDAGVSELTAEHDAGVMDPSPVISDDQLLEPDVTPSGAAETPGSSSPAPGDPSTPSAPAASGDASAPVTTAVPLPDVNVVGVPGVLEPVGTPTDTSYPPNGLLLDDRPLPGAVPEPTASADCASIQSITDQGRRTTVGMGIQLRTALRGSAGLPLDSRSYANCLELVRTDGAPVTASLQGAPASNGLTLILAQPGATEEANALIRDAALRLFMSRPRGERVALFRWATTAQQVMALGNHRDSFGDALNQRFAVLDGEPLDASVAVTAAANALLEVADDAHAWTRTVVVLAPTVAARDLVQFERDVDVIWAVDTTDTTGFAYVHTTPTAPADAMGQVSARLDAIRASGFVTLGVCGDGALATASVRAPASGAERLLELDEALPEERMGACDPTVVAGFSHYDTRLVEIAFTPEQRELYDAVVDDRDDTVDFELSLRLSPEHAATPSTANLRGGTSLAQCPPNRMNFSLDLEGGRERFFFPESSGSVGSDEFYLTAMCLDPMYINQYTMDRLMASLGMFVSGVRLVEVRVDGATQGVYLLMEQVKEALVRNQSGLLSVIRRRNGSSSEVKLPGVDDPDGQAAALETFDALRDSVEGLTGPERLSTWAAQVDLYRYLYFAAVQSAIHNADWADEPTFFATATIGSAGTAPFFGINGWDPDDVLLGECAHEAAMDDPFGMIGCAEHPIEKALFGGDRRATTPLDDEVYALYVGALETVLAHLTEERVGEFYATTAGELSAFAQDPAIAAVMPDWSDLDDVGAAINETATLRIQAYTERRAYLLSQLAAYRAAH